ncbi:hypothetical protein HDU86_001313 [Geranomyces michiganensis]|nr:hypothetical protein HDU86_001313 [Geranomyces michiganensis]
MDAKRRAGTPRVRRQGGVNSDGDPLCLFVQEIPTDNSVTAQDLNQLFSQYGQVLEIRMKTAYGDTRLNGNATVSLRNPNREFEDLMLDGRTEYLSLRRGSGSPNCALKVRLDRNFSGGGNRARLRPNHDVDTISLARFAIGKLVKPDVLYENWFCTEQVSLSIDYTKYQCIQVHFANRDSKFMLEYHFKNVRDSFKIARDIRGDQYTYHVIASLSLPPKVCYAKVDPCFHSISGPKWVRAALPRITGRLLPLETMFADESKSQIQAALLRLPETGNFMDHHYTLEFTRTGGEEGGVIGEEETRFLRILERLQTYGVVANVHRIRDCTHVPPDEVPTPYDIEKAPLEVKFKLLGLISYNVISEHGVNQELIDELASMNPAIAEGVLDEMGKPKKHIWDPAAEVRRRKDEVAAIEAKVVITPTKIYYQGPQHEVGNRILRRHAQNTNDFLRVTFCDDTLQRVSGRQDGELLFSRIAAILDAGITIADKRFEFLHYSNSSMKSCGCWFINPFDKPNEHVDAERIRDTMGDFSGIENPATLGARMAQCFSTTTVTGKIGDAKIMYIPDVERNGFVFSDGVGKIGKDVIKNVCEQLKKYQRVRPIMFSAVQYRLAGAKGVLVLDPTIDRREVHLRKSQTKFTSNHYAMEICRTSFFSPGYLNHQLVMLLETLGIKKEVFLQMKDESISELNESLRTAKAAIQTLSRNQDQEGMAAILVELIKAGLFEAREPFLMNQLKIFKALQLKDIKRRARILIKDSCHLIGVMDETGKLPEGKLFVQITNPLTEGKEVKLGRAFVTRSPALHPGDVQIVECVNIPELAHLLDVVVFSQHGERPLPNMLAGGDLDGDTFTVCWDQRLIPAAAEAPMTYNTAMPIQTNADKSVAEIKRHFITYIQQDNLGQIDNSHKALADRNPDGARYWKCIRLAELHSDAVDFAKKGVPARKDSELRAQEWPDFMEKDETKKITYQSHKALGDIYRSVTVKLELLKDFEPLPELVVPGYEAYLEDALLSKAAYDAQITTLMNQYNIGSEFELVSGYMFNFRCDESVRKKPEELKEQVMQSVYNIKTQFRDMFWTVDVVPGDTTVSSFRRREAVVSTHTYLPEAIKRKASAWYVAAYGCQPSAAAAAAASSAPITTADGAANDAVIPSTTSREIELEEAEAEHRRAIRFKEKDDREYYEFDMDMSGRFYSFPWVMYDVLCNVYKTAKEVGSFATAAAAEPSSSTSGRAKPVGSMMAGTADGPFGHDPTDAFLRPAGSEAFWQKMGATA